MPSLPQLPGVEHRYVDVDGLRVHVAEAGEGPPLVLLHGWPQHWWCWRLVVPLLAPSYRLVVPDLRGHGWTGAPTDGYDKEQLASDLLGLLDVLGLDRVGLVGHDWGGWSGFLACLREPQRFDGFLALGILHPFQRPDAGKALQAWRMAYQLPLSTPVLGQALLRSSPKVVQGVVRLGSTRQVQDTETYGEVLQEAARAQASVALYRTFLTQEAPAVLRGRYRDRRLTVPTRLVVGSDDPVASPALLRGWERHATDMAVHVLPGVGHFVPEEAPGEVADHVRALFPVRGGATG